MSDAPGVEDVLLDGVDVHFGEVRVLRGVDLCVARGERVVLVGANGAGKTTMLKVIGGLLGPTRGRVRVLGGDPAEPPVRRRLGLLGHRPGLYSHLTAAENLRFWGRLHGIRDAERRGRALLEALGLDATDRRPVDAWSQGMRQRAGIARCLLTDPDVLLLDEPFAALDGEGERAAVDMLDAHPATVVLVTHHPERVPLRGMRVMRLSHGRLAVPAATS